jgi:hypothetical protein
MSLANNPLILNHAASERQFLSGNPKRQSAGMKRRTPNRAGRRPPRIDRFLALLLLLGLCRATPACAQQSTNTEEQITALQSEMNTAIQQVQRIVNQPVARYAHTSRMHVTTFNPGWFHEGASKPSFNSVDVRSTQEAIYDQYEYITSVLNPAVVFVGRQCEFNGMTKYFYLDRSVPKKKLTQTEMVEINRLYRIIGRCEMQLARLQNPEPASTSNSENSEPASKPEKARRLLSPYAGGALLFVALLVLYFSYKRRTQ